MNKIGIAMAGFGSIGRIHNLSYRDIPLFYPGVLPELDMAGVLCSSPESSRKCAEAEGFRKGYARYEEILKDPEVDIVDIVTPNYLHKEQIIRALEAGKHVLCEKPLALNGDEAAVILTAAQRSDRQVGMIFNYRFIPAVRRAKELIAEGRVGDIYSFRGEYFHTGYQNPNRPHSWRMDRTLSGGGALADLGVHVIDILHYLLGDFSTVRADLSTFIKERPLPGDGGTRAEVTVDDAAWLQCSLCSGGKGSIEVSRFATGALDDLNITVYGSKGAFRFRLMDPNFLYWFEEANRESGWTRLETLQYYEGAKIPHPRSVIGWTRFHMENQYSFLKAMSEDRLFAPGAGDGVRAQFVLDAAYRSGGSGREEPVRQI